MTFTVNPPQSHSCSALSLEDRPAVTPGSGASVMHRTLHVSGHALIELNRLDSAVALTIVMSLSG
jgi:hypothetical protein